MLNAIGQNKHNIQQQPVDEQGQFTHQVVLYFIILLYFFCCNLFALNSVTRSNAYPSRCCTISSAIFRRRWWKPASKLRFHGLSCCYPSTENVHWWSKRKLTERKQPKCIHWDGHGTRYAALINFNFNTQGFRGWNFEN